VVPVEIAAIALQEHSVAEALLAHCAGAAHLQLFLSALKCQGSTSVSSVTTANSGSNISSDGDISANRASRTSIGIASCGAPMPVDAAASCTVCKHVVGSETVKDYYQARCSFTAESMVFVYGLNPWCSFTDSTLHSRSTIEFGGLSPLEALPCVRSNSTPLRCSRTYRLKRYFSSKH
jgi:hypothetical protein